jgi:flagellar biosynthetic protein FliP
MKKQIKSIFCLILLGLFVLPTKVIAVDVNELSDTINKISGNTGSSDSVKMFVMMTVLTLIPALLILTTSFTRIIMVLSFVRSSLGTQQTPPNQVLIGIALFLTFFIMHPVYNEVNKVAIQPLIKDEISQSKAIEEAEKPIKKFMLKETREKDLALFVKYSNLEKVKNPESLPTYVVVPAFLISELRTAFSIGFLIFIPFLIIDMAVSSILMSMISLPFKLLLFVLVDGWYLVVETLVRGFQ